MQDLTKWAADFLDEVSRHREEHTQLALNALRESRKHEEAYDYGSAVTSLEAVPKRFQTEPLPGQSDSVEDVLERLYGVQTRIQSLEAGIRQRVSQRHLDDLLPEVEELLALRPDRADVQKLREQLIAREQKQLAARDDALASAQQCTATHDYEGALAHLSGVSAAMVTPEIVTLRSEADRLASTAKKLARTIDQAVAKKALDGLLPTVEEYLRLKPRDGKKESLRQSLVVREAKISSEVATALSKAELLEKSAKFDSVLDLLTRIPQTRQGAAILEIRERVESYQLSRASVMRALTTATKGDYAKAISAGTSYADAIRRYGITDAEFEKLLKSVTEAAQQEELWRRRLLIAKVFIASVASLVLLIVIGLYVRSAVRSSALSSAIASSRWDDALEIDPTNAQALLGRALVRSDSADFVGAFADLDRVALKSIFAAEVNAARVEVYLDRGKKRLESHDFSGALADFYEAEKGEADEERLSGLRLTLLEKRGLQRVESGDLEGAQEDLATMANLDASSVATLRNAIEGYGNKSTTFLNSLGMTFVRIPAGQFSMGSATGDPDEQPVHEVRISQPFYLGVYEVTEADWSRVMGGNKGSSTRPVVDVSWEDAVSFCAKLSALPAEQAAGRVYRLPTEAEWEYACRAGTTTAYSFGDDESLRSIRGFCG